MSLTLELEPLGANQRLVAATTGGICRNMQIPDVIGPGPSDLVITPFGGGDLNGTNSSAILFYQAGTAGDQLSMPRKPPNPGNYCGVV